MFDSGYITMHFVILISLVIFSVCVLEALKPIIKLRAFIKRVLTKGLNCKICTNIKYTMAYFKTFIQSIKFRKEYTKDLKLFPSEYCLLKQQYVI